LAGVALLGLARPALASEADIGEALLSLLDDRKTAATLGGLWLKAASQTRAEVLAGLQAGLRDHGWTGAVDSQTLRSAMADTVADDFRAGKLVTLDGWQIAEAQAQLCALAYFAEAGSL
jgi:hypothetical protein